MGALSYTPDGASTVVVDSFAISGFEDMRSLTELLMHPGTVGADVKVFAKKPVPITVAGELADTSAANVATRRAAWDAAKGTIGTLTSTSAPAESLTHIACLDVNVGPTRSVRGSKSHVAAIKIVFARVAAT